MEHTDGKRWHQSFSEQTVAFAPLRDQLGNQLWGSWRSASSGITASPVANSMPAVSARLAEVAGQIDDLNTAVVPTSRHQQRQCVITAAVVDTDDLVIGRHPLHEEHHPGRSRGLLPRCTSAPRGLAGNSLPLALRHAPWASRFSDASCSRWAVTVENPLARRDAPHHCLQPFRRILRSLQREVLRPALPLDHSVKQI